MATLGNREDLFPGSGYVDKYTKPPTTYDIPPSALEDETFAALITEAEKYIGYQPCHGFAGAADLSHADGRVGTEIDGDCKRQH